MNLLPQNKFGEGIELAGRGAFASFAEGAAAGKTCFSRLPRRARFACSGRKKGLWESPGEPKRKPITRNAYGPNNKL